MTSLILGNIIGATKFVSLLYWNATDIWSISFFPKLPPPNLGYTLSIPVGLLAYPFTFLATDLICEIYGKSRAQILVWIGLLMNILMLLIMYLGHVLPNSQGISGGEAIFEQVYDYMIVVTMASMIAYFITQFIDVWLFHFWKNLTKGKHLWLRNNGSTLISQLVDSIIIISILYVSDGLGIKINSISALAILIINSYVFKFIFSLLDTPLFYFFAKRFKNYSSDRSMY